MPSILICLPWPGRRKRTRSSCDDGCLVSKLDCITLSFVRCVISYCPTPTMMQDRATVVVVGAGVAGLTAASRLRQLGIDDVLVVEAAEHVGGRIKQVEGVLPWPVELGPEFVHGAKSSLKVLRCGRTRALDTVQPRPSLKRSDASCGNLRGQTAGFTASSNA